MKKLFVLFAVVMLVLTGCNKTQPVENNTESETVLDMSKANSIADLKGAKIAVQAGTLHAELASQIEDATLTSYAEISDMVAAVKSGGENGAIMDEPIGIVYAMKDSSLDFIHFRNNDNGFKADASLYSNSAAFVKGAPLYEEVNSIISEVPMDTYLELMEQILKISDGGTVDMFVLESEEPTEYKGVLRVGMECASEPFNWTDIEGSTFGSVPIKSAGYEGMTANGLDVQVAKYVANKLGYELEVYAIEWDSLLPALSAGQIDCIIGNMSPTEERKAAGYDFTSSYYDVNYVILYKK